MTKLERLAEIKERTYFIERDKDLRYQIEVNKADKDWLITNLENELAKSARLREALNKVTYVLTYPASEYVPSIPDAWAVIDKAIAEYDKEHK